MSDTARPAIDTAELNDVYVRMLRATTSGRLTDEAFNQAGATPPPCPPTT